MTRDLAPWLFVLLLLGAGMIMAVAHAESMRRCALAGIETGTAETVKQGSVPKG